MTREQLEAAIWRIATYHSTDLGGKGTSGYLLTTRQVTEILAAADAYAAGDTPELTALRRDILRTESAPMPERTQ